MTENMPDTQMLDHQTSRSICNAVGERLQRDLSPQSLAASSQLERLIDELRRRETAGRGT